MMTSDMDNSMRGFSFMPDIKMKEMDLQYVEDCELEQAWRSRRRERLKQQEQKIWEEFIQEQDIVQSVYKSDPYQFIENIPETCLQELLEKEFNKMQKKMVEEELKEEDAVEIATSLPDTPSIVIQNDKIDMERQDMQEVLHIFYDDKDNEELSGNEGEALNESGGSPLCTVRENQEEKEEPKAQELSPSPEKVSVSGKSSGNVATMVENSIYCAKVKELRARINEELLSIIATVEQQNLINMDLEDLKKIQKRSSEFSSRFSRIHLYQLQRQIEDLKRHSSAVSLPFGQHTQLQAQMVRTVSLYQNLWQAFSALHKWFRQSGCAGGAGAPCRGAARLLRAAPHPHHDDLLQSCDRFEETVTKHGERADELIKSLEDGNNPYAKKPTKNMGKKNPSSAYLKAGVKSTSRADGKLSMYSLDTLRINLKAKPSSTRDNLSSGTSKLRGTANKAPEKRAPDKNKTPKHQRKSPAAARARTRRAEADVRTLVEAVTCTSSHVSFEASSQRSPNPKDLTYRSKGASQSGKSKETTPRSKLQEISRKSQKVPNVPKNSICGENSTVQSCSELRNEEINDEITKNFKDSPRAHVSLRQDGAQSRRSEKEKIETESGAAGCEVSKLLRQLCGGDATGKKNGRVSGAKNAQLHCVSSNSPRQPTTPQLLRILEEAIQKKSPRSTNLQPLSNKDVEKFRMTFNITEKTVENLFQYRTKFVQHMLSSAMYANSAVEKPWEMVSRVSEQIIDELLLSCAKEMELKQVVQQLYKCETQ